LKMGRRSCPETSVNDYHSTLCNAPEERTYYEGISWSGSKFPVIRGLLLKREALIRKVY
jgi:hypothetical protein